MFGKNKNKIFCIGLNKTGTTTIEKALKEFNYKLGDQTKGELLIKDWYKKDFSKILRMCYNADAFQDIPFSLPYTYIFLEQYFKNAKFILTVRDSPEQWYNSLLKFHSKIWSKNSGTPTINDLKKAEYRYKGFAFESNRLMFNAPIDEPYKKEVLLDYYNNHNYSVKEYFRNDPGKLLIINVSNNNDYFRLCEFLEKKPLREQFPWENKTSNI